MEKAGDRVHEVLSVGIPAVADTQPRFIVLLSVVLILLCVQWPNSAHAQWSRIGPEGGYIKCLAIDPQNTQTIYAGSSDTWSGVFKSTNGGVSWTQVNSGLAAGTQIRSLAVDPQNTDIIYAGTGRHPWGVYKSTNGGANWTQLSSGLPSVDVYALAIDSQNTQTIYAGTYDGVFKSTDSGTSWVPINSGLTGIQTYSLAIDPHNAQIIYAGTSGISGASAGVFKTTNGGVSWIQLNSGLTSPSANFVAIDPQDPQTIYAGTYLGVFKSTNGGAGWIQLNSGLTSPSVHTLAIDPLDPQTVYAGTYDGVFKSTNGGGSWTQLNSGLASAYVYSLAVDPQNTQTIYAGTSGYFQGTLSSAGGVFKSTNGGSSWNQANSGLKIHVYSLAVDPQDTQTIYAGTMDNGVFKSSNAGLSWSLINGEYDHFSTLAIDPENTQTIYAGTNGWGIFKSTNGGTSWSWMVSGLPSHYGVFPLVWTLAVDPQDTQTIYAGSYESLNGGGVYKSSNGGASWVEINVGLPSRDVRSLAIDPENTQIIYAGTSQDGLYKSMNGGTSWSPCNSGLGSAFVESVVIDPHNTQTIYAGTGDGAFKSTNGGSSWGPVNSGLASDNILSLVLDPANPRTSYAGTYGGGVYKSVIAGASWYPISSGLTTDCIDSLFIDPQNTQTIYALAYGGALFKTTNGGESSTLPIAPAGLTATAISASQIILNWLDLSENETGFKIERKTGTCASTSAWAEIAAIGPNATTFTNTKLAANKTFSYRIRACNGAGNSDYSACVSAKTALAGTPAAPTGLTATAASAGKISLKWTDKSKNETGFQIYRQKDSEPWTLLATTTMNVKKYDDTSAFGNDVTAFNGYYVTACNGGGCSPPTNTAIVPFKPTAIRAVSSAGKINLKWTDKSDNETGYQVYRKAGSCKSTGSWELIATTGANVHAHSDPDVPPETPYSYKVRAFIRSAALPYAMGYSLYSGCATTTASKGAYSLADLAGTWRLNGLGSRFDTQFWRRGDLSVDKSGGFSISQTYSDGSLKNDTGTLSIGDDGMVASDGLPNMSACMEAGKSILGFTDTWPDGSIEMGILTKNANGYSSADLTGTWRGYGFASYHEAPWWDEVTATIKDDGTFTGSSVECDGDTEEISGAFSISPDGVVSVQGQSFVKGFIDAGKTLLVWTDTWNGHGGTSEMMVLARKASSYLQSDLEGLWKGNGLVFGGGGAWWERSTLTIDPDGSGTSVSVKSSGSKGAWNGVLSISKSGAITSPDDLLLRGTMDAGKTVMVLISPRDDDTTAFHVFTRMIQ